MMLMPGDQAVIPSGQTVVLVQRESGDKWRVQDVEKAERRSNEYRIVDEAELQLVDDK